MYVNSQNKIVLICKKLRKNLHRPAIMYTVPKSKDVGASYMTNVIVEKIDSV